MSFLSMADDDIFISYSRRDASSYAAGLADELTKRGFSCFIDRLGTDPDEVLPDSFKHKIRGCSMLVVVCTEWAGTRPIIAEEINEFLSTGRRSAIVPVDFDGALHKAQWYGLIRGIASETEHNPNALINGEPSLAVISRIEKQFTYTRRNVRLRRVTFATATLLIFLLIASVAAGVYAAREIGRAKAALATTELARIETAGEKSKAQSARREAESAQTEAAAAKRELTEQTRLADIAANEAQEKTRLAEVANRQASAAASSRVVALAEAAAQQRLSKALALANRAESVREEAPEQLPVSTLLAAESMRRVQTLAADQALRRGLSLMPHIIGQMPHQGEARRSSSNPLGNFSPDGQHLVTLGNKEILVWKAMGVSAHPVARLSHLKRVLSFAFSPDSRYLITTGWDQMARVWEKWRTQEPEQVAVMPHSNPTEDVVVSSKSKYVAVLDREHIVHFWIDWNSAKARQVALSQRPPENSYGAEQVAFAGDESRLFMQINADKVAILDPATGKRISELMGAKLTDDKRFLLSAGENNELRITALADEREIVQVKGIDAKTIIQFSRTLEYSAAAHRFAFEDRGGITIIDTGSGDVITKLPPSLAVYGDVTLSPDGNLLATTDRIGRVVRIWRVADETREEVARLAVGEPVNGAIFSPDSRSIATIGERSARLWATTSYHEDEDLAVDGDLSSLAVSPDGAYIGAVADSRVHILNAATGEQVVRPFEIERGRATDKSGLTFSRDGRYLAVAFSHHAYVYTDWRTAPRLIGTVFSMYSSDKAAFSPDGEYLAVESASNVAVWRRKDWGVPEAKPILVPCDGDFIFSHDGRFLITTCGQGLVRIWEGWQFDQLRSVSSFRIEPENGGPVEAVYNLALSPDGNRLAATTSNEHIVVWEAWSKDSTRRLISRMTGLSLRRIAFSPDGRYIGGTNYPYASIWDVLSGSEIVRIRPRGVARASMAGAGPIGEIRAIAFSHDGKHFVVGGDAQKPGMWLWRQSDLLGKACEYLNEMDVRLSTVDWLSYFGEKELPQTCPAAPGHRSP